MTKTFFYLLYGINKYFASIIFTHFVGFFPFSKDPGPGSVPSAQRNKAQDIDLIEQSLVGSTCDADVVSPEISI